MSKDAFFTGYEKLVKDVENHHDKLDESDWVDIDEEFKTYVEVCYPKYKTEMSAKEKINFWKQTISYGAHRGSASGDFLPDVNIDFQSELDELTDQGRDEVLSYLKEELQPDLETTIDEVVKEVEKLGEGIKRINSKCSTWNIAST